MSWLAFTESQAKNSAPAEGEAPTAEPVAKRKSSWLETFGVASATTAPPGAPNAKSNGGTRMDATGDARSDARRSSKDMASIISDKLFNFSGQWSSHPESLIGEQVAFDAVEFPLSQ